MSDLIKMPTPMEWSAKTLATLMSRVDEIEDEGGQLSASLIQAFQEAKGSLQWQIDCRQAIANEIDAKIDAAKKYRDQVNAYIARLKKLDEQLKEDAQKAIEALPGTELRGSNGKKVYLAKSAGALKFKFDLKESRTFSNIIDAETASFFDIEDKYLKRISFLALDTDAIKNDLKQGVALDWAHIEYSQHVRGL